MKIRISKCVACDNLTLCVQTDKFDMRCKGCLGDFKADIERALDKLEEEIEMLLTLEDDD